MGLNQLVRGSQQCKWFPTAFLHLSCVRLASARPHNGSWVLRPRLSTLFVIPQGKPPTSHSNGIGRILLTPGGTLMVLCPLPRMKNTYIDKTPEEQKLPARILPTHVLPSWKEIDILCSKDFEEFVRGDDRNLYKQSSPQTWVQCSACGTINHI